MNLDDLCKRFRELAASGKDLDNILFDDSVHEVYCELCSLPEFNKDKLEAAFVEGRREHRITSGWIVVWTDARADYDQFGTEELDCFDWNGRTLRRVLVEPGNLVFQRSRYLSGAAYWDEDPRETERKIQETIAKERSEREEKERIRAAGLEWIQTVDEKNWHRNKDKFDDELRLRGLNWNDVLHEQARRVVEQEAIERSKEWERCRSTFPDGCTIVDPGNDAYKAKFPDQPYGPSDVEIYRNVRVVPHWSAKDSVHDARVEDERHNFVGSLWRVADRLNKGLLRIAKEDEKLPPNAVVDRLKPSRLDRLVRVECEGRVVWAGRERFSYEIIVLDEQGRLVRKKSIREAVELALRKKEGYT